MCVWGGGCVEQGEEGRFDTKGGMRGTLCDGHSDFIITLLHLVSHQTSVRGLTAHFMRASQWRMTRLVVVITPHTGGNRPAKLSHV